MTRAKVLQLGFGVFLLGGIGYYFFRLIGFQGFSAGIASEALLIAVVLLWTFSYLFRVVTGKMTFTEQRKRYMNAFEKITDQELQAKFEALSEEDKRNLLNDIERDNSS